MYELTVYKREIYLCPTCDITCPYWQYNDECVIGNPLEECDEYYAILGEENQDGKVSEM